MPARSLQALPKRPVWNAPFNGVSTAREGQGEGETHFSNPQLGAATGPPCGAKQGQVVAPWAPPRPYWASFLDSPRN